MAARRQYAEREAKSLQELLTEPADLVYYAQPGVAYPPSVEVVDYDLAELHQSGAGESRCCELADIDRNLHRIIVNLPKFVPFSQIEQDICAASRVLSPTGELCLLVPAKSGHKRIAALLETFFAEVKHRSGPPHPFLCRQPLPRSHKIHYNSINYSDPVSGRTLRFKTRPGLFSHQRIDTGTGLLLSHINIRKGDRVLDVGCGYGAIGIVAAARKAEVELVDSDSRAVEITRRNFRSNQLSGLVFLTDQLDEFPDESFDTVLSNPPTHGGSDTLRALFSSMVRVIKPGGRVFIVLREKLNYEKWLREIATIDRVTVKAGYKILCFS